MRGLLGLAIALGLLWGGYWFLGARAMERAAEDWFDSAKAEGLVAEKTGFSLQGFPSRFDLTFEGLHLADPVSGYGWKAPFAQVLMLSYQPWHLIAALPNDQSFETPFGAVDLHSAKLQASLVLKPALAVGLDRFVLAGEELRVSGTGGALAADSLSLGSRLLDADSHLHEIGLAVLGLHLDPKRVAPLPDVVERLRLDADVRFTAALDRYAPETRPMLAAVTLREASVGWGSMTVYAKGEVSADAEGYAAGRIDIRFTEWRQGLAAAVELGLITAEVAPTVEKALTLLSQDTAVVDLPLVFSGGRMSLGPVPLGAAPRLR